MNQRLRVDGMVVDVLMFRHFGVLGRATRGSEVDGIRGSCFYEWDGFAPSVFDHDLRNLYVRNRVTVTGI